MAILTPEKIDEFYKNSSAQIQTGIEKFTNTASGVEIYLCTKLYLNIAKYKPLKDSSYIPLPKALENKKKKNKKKNKKKQKKPIINVKNKDKRHLKWPLKSALYPAKSHLNNIVNYTKYPPVSQIAKVEKNKTIWQKCLWILSIKKR